MVDVKKIAENVRDMAYGDDEHKDGNSKKRAAFSGAMVGMTGGVIMGYCAGWNILLSMLIGGLAGGVITGIIVPKD